MQKNDGEAVNEINSLLFLPNFYRDWRGQVKLARKLWQRALDLLPIDGFHFDRPIVIFQSDDWGRVGLRDQAGLEQLHSAGLSLGERPYDYYTLETVEDLAALQSLLKKHRDSVGRNPCLGMNFILENLDFSKMSVGGWRQIRLLSLADGFPEGWMRPGLTDAYRDGITERVFHPALHGTTHFSRRAVERSLDAEGDRAKLLRTLWQAGTPYIHWRMPWIGYEYWDPEELEDHRFLSDELQCELIGHTVGLFAKLFSRLPGSACAPGYRANDDTHRIWSQHGIHVAQNGPGGVIPPHFDRNNILQLFRSVEFEPATTPEFSLEDCLRKVEICLEKKVPAVVSLHSINFHSTIRDFRSETLKLLDEFLTGLESEHADLLYLHDEELRALVQSGKLEAGQGQVRVGVSKRKFTIAEMRRMAG